MHALLERRFRDSRCGWLLLTLTWLLLTLAFIYAVPVLGWKTWLIVSLVVSTALNGIWWLLTCRTLSNLGNDMDVVVDIT